MELFRRAQANLRRSPIAYRVARGAFWSLFGGVVSRALAVLTSVIVARLLGREGYGEVGMVQSTVGMFGVFAGFGLGATATKYIAEYRQRDPARAGRIANLTVVVSLLTAGVISLGCLALSDRLAARTMVRASLAPLIEAGALLLLVSALGGVLSAALAGFEAFRELARIQIWQGVAAPLITVPLVRLYGAEGAVSALTVNAALGLGLLALALRRRLFADGLSLRYDRLVWREAGILWRFALPSLLSSVLLIPVMWVTNLMLVRRPEGYGELGVFNAANQWRMVIVFLPTMLAAAVLPVLAETFGSDDRAGYRRTLVMNLRATWVIALPVTALTIVLAEPIAALFGRQFAGMGAVLPALMIATFLAVVNATIGAALAGSGRIWTGTFMNLGWAIVLIAVAARLIPGHGARGLATAYLVSYLVHTAWQTAYVELRLASLAILGQWRLIVFTAAVLALCVSAGSGRSPRQMVTGFLLTAGACLPLLRMMRRAVRA